MTEQELYDLMNNAVDGERLKNSRYLRDAVTTNYKRYEPKLKSMGTNDPDLRKYKKVILEDAQKYYAYSKKDLNEILEGRSDQIKAEHLVDLVMPFVQSIRKAIFLKTDPPFANMDDARRWIEDKDNTPIESQIQKKIDSLTKFYGEYCEMLKKDQIVSGISLSRNTLDYPGPDGWVYSVISDYDKVFSILRHASSVIVNATGFQPAAVTELILTGAIPELKRFKVNVKRNYTHLSTGDVFRNIIDIEVFVSDLTFNEIKIIYDYYRSKLKVTGKKSITEKQKILLAFIDDYGQPPARGAKGTVEYWTAAKEAWNIKHSEITSYTTWEGIRKAYYGILDKLNM